MTASTETELFAKPTGWTPERRARQAQMIHLWQPWRQSTGPRTVQGKATSSRNAARRQNPLRQLLLEIAADVRRAQQLVRKSSAKRTSK